MSREAQLRQAAAELVSAFASNDTKRYFSCFSEDATFIFHSLAQPLHSRREYEALWQQWQSEGFAVLDCRSSNAVVNMQGDLAILYHDVATRLRTGEEEMQLAERETIVFRLHGEHWLACHEHLSTLPPLT
ncbi:nuclear transport factor 2 family protein [Pseudomonas capeferrum]|uniref:YybH family protein n=1 Tax=Pseudomonas capeferrum TaxID=1495066 RepID=UPI0015E39410|nr:nuclear transport factor 2 family protein [Pseudomonas capeferrum]MBA1202227.1 nuclear transport factor 2 family protein [Pseudomonas capeferrum]